MKLALSSLLLGAASVFACGPFFPSTVLDHPAETLQAAPVATFARELEPLCLPTTFRAASTDTAVAEQNDLRAVQLNSQPLAEFADYQRGADLWHTGKTNDAREVWLTLLKRPANQRRYRSTWAAFMIGRTYLYDTPAQSIPWFQRTRALAADNFYDTLGLAAASFGMEAYAELHQDHLERAANLYLQQLSTGDSTANWSLRIVAERVLKNSGTGVSPVRAAGTSEETGETPVPLTRYARDKNLRRVVTAYIISREQPPEAARAWLVAIEATGNFQLAGADRLAWAAYQVGDIRLATRWLKCAPADSPIAQWLRVKLLLRDGKLDEAAALLANIVRQFPHTDDWYGTYKGAQFDYEKWTENPHPATEHIASELAILQMSRGQFTDSLDLLLRNNYWWDAAYVAERVLTVDELKQYVDQRWPQPDWETYWRYHIALQQNSPAPGVEIRWLLARRLARLGRLDEARPYYLSEFQKEFDKYITGLRTGHDATKPAAERATALWEAARQARWWGMSLLSTEGEPDFHCVEGQYELGSTSSNRLASAVLVTATERQRTKELPTTITARFHYRYLAANLVWDAAQFMPDNTDETARVLCEAGTWLKGRDPKAADRFYKALVKRCGATTLGKEADRLRWFPKLNETEPSHEVQEPKIKLPEIPVLVPDESERTDTNALLNEAGEYVVRSGDTPAGIAQKFNLSIDEIRKLNPETFSQHLRVGQQLHLKTVATESK